MAYHQIRIRQIPRILFAHGYSTDRYDIRFPPMPGMMEITCFEQGDVVKTYEDGEQVQMPAPGLAVTFRDRAFSMRSTAPLHSHSTVGFLADFEKLPITGAQIAALSREAYWQGSAELLTAVMPDYSKLNQQNSNIERQLNQLIRAHASPGSARDVRCTGLLLDLLAEITEECVREAMAGSGPALPPGSVAYAQGAMRYVSAHLDRKLKVNEIAAHLNISEGYLSRLFKSVTGQTVIEYVTRVKLERIRELLVSRRASLREAGESVGICDENYLSRVFKKYMGMTVREYRSLKTL